MADDSDVPPLEDMTEVLKHADAIRDRRELQSDTGKKSQQEKAKERAKVNKKNVTGHTVKPQELAAGDSSSLQQATTVSQATSVQSVPPTKLETSKPVSQESVKKSENNKGNAYGGLKKGFLFGSSNTTKSSSSSKSTKASSQCSASVATQNKSGESLKKDISGPAVESNIPYIKANGKTEPGLTLEEVQQAMSETKGLLDNQEWITDDLLGKIEGNDLLLKRFADPQFMKALEEFQTNPTAAMEKYKDNKEVEKFLLEFCGLLGDHFTQIGSSGTTPPSSQTSKTPSKSQKQASSQSSTHLVSNPTHQTSAGPKIVEITDDFSSPSTSDHKPNSKPKIVEIIDSDTPSAKSEKKSSNSPKIVEISDSDSLTDKTKDIKLSTKPTAKTKNSSTIITRNPTHGADMSEVPSASDEEVKKMLEDPKVMEVLMDPQIMSLIQVLRTDPGKAQRTMDAASPDLKKKVSFLVSKGLLQFQSG